MAGIVLAAGAGVRMGRLKQLLPYAGKPLVQHAIEQAMGAGFHPLIVVIGANAPEMRSAIAAQPVEIIEVTDWKAGMGASIAAGVRGLQHLETDAAAVAILLGDQPLVTSEHLNDMRRMLSLSGAKAVAARYDEALGVPALFKRELWTALASLPPSSGARALLRSSAFQVDPYDLPEAAIDLDTPEQYAAVTS